jgi:hypothetical protein
MNVERTFNDGMNTGLEIEIVSPLAAVGQDYDGILKPLSEIEMGISFVGSEMEFNGHRLSVRLVRAGRVPEDKGSPQE